MTKTAARNALLILLALPACGGGAFAAVRAAAGGAPSGSVPGGINYQGRLVDNGFPVTGTRTLSFRLYDAASGGSLLWSSAPLPTAVTQGVFGATLAISTSALAGSAQKYLEVQVDNTTLQPREPLNAVPYALIAKSLEDNVTLASGTIANLTATSLTAVNVAAANLTAGLLASQSSATASAFFGDGSHLSGVSGVLSGGTAGYLPKWTSATTQIASNFWETSSSDTALGAGGFAVVNAFSVGGSTLVVTGGSVGIGTTSPANKLDVNGVIQTEGARFVVNGFDGSGTHWFKTGAAEPGSVFMAVSTDAAGNAGLVKIAPGGTTGLAVVPSGGVGVGTTSPLSKLTVQDGDIRISTSPSAASRGIIFQDGTVQTSAAGTGAGAWSSSGANIYNVNAGNVGLGTSAPGSLLEVAGNMAVKGPLPWIDVRAYGAVGDDSTDNLTAFNNALAAVPAGGGTVFIPPGIYRVSGAIAVNKDNVHIRGSGWGTTTVRTTSASSDVFDLGDGVTGRQNMQLSDMKIDSTVSKTAGAGVAVKSATGARLFGLRIETMFYGIQIQNSVIVYVTDAHLRNMTPSTGVGVYVDGGNDHMIDNVIMDNPPGSQPLAGVDIVNSDATWMVNDDFIHSGYGLLMNPPAGKHITWCFIMNSAFDTNANDGIYINPGAGSTVYGTTFIGDWTSTNSGQGVRLGTTGTIDGMHFIGHRSFNNSQNGFLLGGGANTILDSVFASGNSQASAGAYHGIAVAAGVSGFDIRNVRSGQAAGFANTQGWGVLINSGASNNYEVLNNDLTGNLTGGLSDGGTGTSKQTSGNFPSAGETQSAFGGKLGVGTATPAQKLDVVAQSGTGQAADVGLRVQDGAAGTPKNLKLGINTTGSGYGYVQSTFEGTAHTPVALNPLGGSVGVGTTAPASKLTVQDGDIRISTSPSAPSRGIIFQDGTVQNSAAGTGAGAWSASGSNIYANAGSVGVGTSSPRGKLHVLNGGYDFFQGTTGAGGTDFGVSDTIPIVSGNGFYGYDGLALLPRGWGNAATMDQHRALYIGGAQRNSGAVSSSLAFGNWGYFTNTGTGASGLGNAASQGDAVKFLFQSLDLGAEFNQRLDLVSRSASGVGTTALSVLSNGNVGVGTTSPAQKLDVNGIIQTEGARTIINGFDGTGTHWLRTAAAEPGSVFLGVSTNTAGNANLVQIAPSGALGLAVTSTGNVGIGTTSPATLLDVNGAAQFGSGVAKSTFSAAGGLTFASAFTPTVAQDAATKNYVDTKLLSGGGPWTQAGSVVSLTTPGNNAVVQSTLTVQGNAFSVGGSTLVVTGGNVGIGTASPVANLHVAGPGETALLIDRGGTGNAKTIFRVPGSAEWNVGIDASDSNKLKISNDNTIGSLSLATRLAIDSSGNVGIGTTNPSSLLNLSKVGGYTMASLDQYSTSLVQWGGVVTEKSHLASVGNGATVDTEFLGQFGFTGNTGSGFAQGAYIYGIQNGAAGASWIPTDLRFDTSDGVTAAQARMIVKSGGNVGIGTTSPIGKVSSLAAAPVSNFAATTPGAAQGEKSTSTWYSTFQGTADNGPRRTADISAGFNGGAWGNEYLSFGVGNGGAANDAGNATLEKMRIQSNGNVGIGTTTPTSPLTVVGGATTPVLTVNPGGSFWNEGIWINPSSGSGWNNILFPNTANNVTGGWSLGRAGSGANSGNFYIINQTIGAGTMPLNIIPSGNIGINTSNPGARLDVAGVINGRNFPVPGTGATPQWARLGTFTAGQLGHTIRIVAYIHNGYNAMNSQDSVYTLTFKTSNGTSVDGNGFAGNGSWYAVGDNAALGAGAIKWKANAAGTAATAFDLYLNLPAFTENSHYTVSVVDGAAWTHIGSIGAADPGAASSSVLIPPIEFNIPQGNVGVGTASPATALQVAGDVRVGNAGTNGCVQNFAGTALVGTCASDARLKKNVAPITGVLGKVSALRPVTYEMKAEAAPQRHFAPDTKSWGLIAQEVEKVLPELVATDRDGYKAVRYGPELQMLLIEAVKELKAQNDEIKAQNDGLRERVSALEKAAARGEPARPSRRMTAGDP